MVKNTCSAFTALALAFTASALAFISHVKHQGKAKTVVNMCKGPAQVPDHHPDISHTGQLMAGYCASPFGGKSLNNEADMAMNE